MISRVIYYRKGLNMLYSKNDNSEIESIAKDIISQLLDLYNKKTTPNKYFHELVYERIKTEDIEYKNRVLIEVISLIPYELNVSTSKKYIFVSNEIE